MVPLLYSSFVEILTELRRIQRDKFILPTEINDQFDDCIVTFTFQKQTRIILFFVRFLEIYVHLRAEFPPLSDIITDRFHS